MQASLLRGPFAQFNADILQKVFYVTVDHTESAGYIPRAADEAVVASLSFSDSLQGRVWMSVEAGKIPLIIGRLYERYDIKTPIVSSDVFNEMLNMFVAHLATLMMGQGYPIAISPPDASWPLPDECGDGEHLSVALHTQEAGVFIFDYIYTAR